MWPNLKRESSVLETARQGLTSKMQVDILIGLRLMEHLGQDFPTTFSTSHPKESELLQVLNWIALCIVPNSPTSYDDIAVAITARPGPPGALTLHVSSGGAPPSLFSQESMALFMATLRHALLRGLDPSVIVTSFLSLLASRAFPQILQKMRMIRAVGGVGPARASNRFCALVSMWLRYRPEGETSRGFVNMAIASGGEEHRQANNVMIQSFLSLMSENDTESQLTAAKERFNYVLSVLTLCDLLVNSTFFDDLVNFQEFRLSLEISDLLFLHEVLRRLTQVARYKSGSVEFVYRGVPYLKKLLGHDGMADFMRGSGGISVNWVSTPIQPSGTTARWPISPSSKVRQVLERDSLDLGHLNHDMREDIAQSKVVAGAWAKGAPITPQLHSELQMVLYLEENDIDVVVDAIGLSKPMCWACHCYIEELRSPRRWLLSQTSGKARDDWYLPPRRPDVGAAVLRAVNEQVEQVVEEYAFGCYP